MAVQAFARHLRTEARDRSWDLRFSLQGLEQAYPQVIRFKEDGELLRQQA